MKDSFADLEKIRLEILRDKVQSGLNEFKDDPKIQWVSLRLEKPLLTTLQRLIENEQKTREDN